MQGYFQIENIVLGNTFPLIKQHSANTYSCKVNNINTRLKFRYVQSNKDTSKM